MMRRSALVRGSRFAFVFARLLAIREGVLDWLGGRRKPQIRRRIPFRLELELLEEHNAPGSILSNPALAPIAFLGAEVLDFSGSLRSSLFDATDTGALGAISGTPDQATLDNYWSQAGTLASSAPPASAHA